MTNDQQPKLPEVAHLPVNVLNTGCEARGCTHRIERVGDHGLWRHVPDSSGSVPRHMPVPPDDLEPKLPTCGRCGGQIRPGETCTSCSHYPEPELPDDPCWAKGVCDFACLPGEIDAECDYHMGRSTQRGDLLLPVRVNNQQEGSA